MKEIPAHESLLFGLLLAFAGGFLDAYSYLCRGGVFANTQTGNLVLLAIGIGKGEPAGLVYYLLPVAAFAAGVALVEWLRKKKPHADWRGGLLLCKVGLLVIVGAIPAGGAQVLFFPVGLWDLIANLLVSFLCGAQVSAFKLLENRPYATTMCTGNLRSMVEQFCETAHEKNPAAQRAGRIYFLIIAMFCVGAASSTFLSHFMGSRAVWVCCLPFAASWLLHRRGVRTVTPAA